MTAYFVELGFCFQPRPTVFVLENNACMSFDQANESGGQQALAPWTDGTFWLDFNGASVGWIEMDGLTFFPPLSALPVAA